MPMIGLLLKHLSYEVYIQDLVKFR